LLEELYRGGSRRIVTDYDQREMAGYHDARNTYTVNRRVLEADTIISVPKLKRTESGDYLRLKGTVGTIARKSVLPTPQRRAGPGGDGIRAARRSTIRVRSRTAYPSWPWGPRMRCGLQQVLYRSLRLGSRRIMAGSWHGNIHLA
jgi:hypothetical protein